MNTRVAHVVVGLGFGDEGKGAVVDYLAAVHPVHTVVRYNGGAQAAHNVVLPDGRHHTFHQFGSGTFRGAHTFLSRFVLVEPIRLLLEAAALQVKGVSDPFGLLTIDGRALIITPFHIELNRLKEQARAGGRHGSCGLGIGETRAYEIRYGADALEMRDLLDPLVLRGKLRLAADRLVEQARHIQPSACISDDVLDETLERYARVARLVRIVGPDFLSQRLRKASGDIVFEGAQGVLLDETYGFYPHVTWTNTTTANAARVLDEASCSGSVRKLGLVRTYATRHGAGPLVTEDASFVDRIPEPHNTGYEWAGGMRFGPFDAVATRYALEVTGGVDELAITHLDDLARLGGPRMCHSYEIDGRVVDRLPVLPQPVDLEAQEQLTKQLSAAQPRYEPVPEEEMAAAIGARLDCPIALLFSGPTWRDAVRTSEWQGDLTREKCHPARGKCITSNVTLGSPGLSELRGEE
ncbi:MAG: adenylosuccinate synthetase [Chloroflexota bacterium]|nr:adenylosuccinate synthetase [Chloroflexota bacterium]